MNVLICSIGEYLYNHDIGNINVVVVRCVTYTCFVLLSHNDCINFTDR